MRQIILAVIILFISLQTFSQKTYKILFDSKMEVSGKKFALKDINPNLPQNWDNYNYVVIEYCCSTPQRFQLGFNTADGYNELRVMCYVPGAWNKLAIPLKYFTELPDPALDLAATYNHARYTGWINLGGKRGPLHQVDSIGIRMRKPIHNPSIELRSVSLSINDPGDLYMDSIPAIDEFGQSNLMEWEGKAHSLADLQKDWKTEAKEKTSTSIYNYSKFGGYKQQQAKATGFFRTEKINDRWWLVDPEGYLFLSVGIDCVSIGEGLNIRDYNQRSNMYKELPPEELMKRSRNKENNNELFYSYGMWNLYRRYGENFKEKAQDRVISRMNKWGLNTIANWSELDIIKTNRKAFLLPLSGLGLSNELMGLCDIYDPTITKVIDDCLKNTTEPLKNNPWLIGYFIGNEPAWLNQEARLCNVILNGKDRPIKTKLLKYLKEQGDTPEIRKSFILNAFHDFIQLTNTLLKRHDPNHLNLGIRFGDPLTLDNRIMKMCGETFDVFSFNCYDICPNPAMMNRVKDTIDLPIIIGEYHFGTVDRGMAQSLWQVDSQKQRGVAYSYYTEQAYSHPSIVGTGYFQWCDQDITGRRDGENYNCGIIDVTDRPYKEQTEAMMKTAKRLFKIHKGLIPATKQIPMNCRGHEPIPDIWNK